MTDVLAYLRASTEEQAASGLGLDAQRAAIEDEAARKGWTIVEWISDDGYSGKSLDRPGIGRALELLEDGGPDVLVAAKLDRLARSAIDFLGLVERAKAQGWALVVLDLGVDMTTPVGKFAAGIMAQVAELERELISQRTRDALAAARRRGTRLGRPSAVPDDVRERIARDRARGVSYAKIAEALNSEGIPTAHGGAQWWASTVRAITQQHDVTSGPEA